MVCVFGSTVVVVVFVSVPVFELIVVIIAGDWVLG